MARHHSDPLGQKTETTIPGLHRPAASGFDPARGALFLVCECGWEDVVFPSPGFGSLLVAQEAAQVERFRAHVREAP